MKACIAKQQLPFPPTAPAEKLGTAPVYKQHHELTSSYTDPNSADRGRLSPAWCTVQPWCPPDVAYPEVNPAVLNEVFEFESRKSSMPFKQALENTKMP